MADTLSPPVAPPPRGVEAPDTDFWGPSRADRRRARGLVRPVAPAGAVDRLLDHLRAWRADPRAGVAVLVVVAVVAGFAWYRIGLGSGGGTDEPAVAAPPAAVPASSAPAPSGPPGSNPSAGGDVTVHVAGAVARPGVVELAGGTRVIDAVEAAGGGLPDADLDRMNLAARLVDGQRILVQRVGEPPAPAEPATAPAPGGEGSPTSAPINLNTATTEQLETLPGIGPALAAAIITERDRRGGFRSVNELRDVRGIGDKRFADLEGLVTV